MFYIYTGGMPALNVTVKLTRFPELTIGLGGEPGSMLQELML